VKRSFAVRFFSLALPFLRTSEGRAFELSAGPPWFYKEGYPLEPFVGETVTVTGEIETNQNKTRSRSATKTM